MNGHVFQTHPESRNLRQFHRSLEELELYVSRTFKNPGDLRSIFSTSEHEKTIAPPTIADPKGPTIENSDGSTTEKEEDAWTAVERMMLQEECKRVIARRNTLKENLHKLWSVIWGQCSPSMQERLIGTPGYDSAKKSDNAPALIQYIKGVSFDFESQQHPIDAIDTAITKFFGAQQGATESLSMFHQRFRTLANIVTQHAGSDFFCHDGALRFALNAAGVAKDIDPTSKPYAACLSAGRNMSIAMRFLKATDKARYGTLVTDITNQYARGLDGYPKDLNQALTLLTQYVPPTNNSSRSYQNDRSQRSGGSPPGTTPDSALTFVQSDTNPDLVPNTDGRTFQHATCRTCGKRGHYSHDLQGIPKCPSATDSGTQLIQQAGTPEEAPTDEDVGFTLVHDGITLTSSVRKHIIPPTWVLLDSQSTVSIFNNRDLLRDIKPSSRPLAIRSSGGVFHAYHQGHLPNFGPVWYHPDSVANILSMAAVSKTCRVTMDTQAESAILVHRNNKSVLRFVQCPSGLYYHNVDTNNKIAPQPYLFSFVNTVAKNKSLFTTREIKGADRARALQRRIGYPSQQQFENALKTNLITNCPITVDDAKRAVLIYGPPIPSLKGKTTQNAPKPLPNFIRQQIPAPILDTHRDIVLSIDNFFVNGNIFLHSISRKIKFRTITSIPNRLTKTLVDEVLTIVNVYRARGFNVTDIHADQEFTCMHHKPGFENINFTFSATDDHVHDVERSIRTIKERVRAGFHSLPFERIPRALTRALVEKACQDLNSLPALDGISSTLSPLTIVTGRPGFDYNTLRLDLGEYVQVFEANLPTNTPATRTTGALALCIARNNSGAYNFMSLATGRVITRRQWTRIPLPTEVIAHVNQMAQAERQPPMPHGEPIFELTPGTALLDIDVPMDPQDHDDDDATAIPADEQDHQSIALIDDANDDDAHSLVEPEGAGDILHNPVDFEGAHTDHVENEGADDATYDTPDDDNVSTTSEPGSIFEPSTATHIPAELEGADNDPGATTEQNKLETTTAEEITEQQHGVANETPRYNLRPNRDRSYGHRLNTQMDTSTSTKTYSDLSLLQDHITDYLTTGNINDTFQCITGYVMNQMSAEAGIKKFGQQAIDAIFKEFAQLNDKKVFSGMDPTKLTKEEKQGALRAITVVKEKRCGKIKGRTVADGRPQRKLYSKIETTSPTVATDSLMTSLIIDAYEGRDVACADITGAYLNADMEDLVILKVSGPTVQILCDINPDLSAFVCKENGRDTLYLRLIKALYGCVQSALLWYKLLVETLMDLGFKLNPTDACVANAMVNGKQCTIAWYVDDNKISHVDPNIVTNVINNIESRFGKMAVTRGDEHVFLGMKIKFDRTNKTVSIDMNDYAQEAIEDFLEHDAQKLNVATTGAQRTLFEIDEKSEKLSNTLKDVFHSIVAKLLYISKRGRPDIQLPVAHLCTRVDKCTKKDWGKLRRILEYLNGTQNLPLTLGADTLDVIHTWVDAAHGVHSDARGHTGGSISFGRGTLANKSIKQKLNSKSSTETELIGTSDYLPEAINAKYFLEGQGQHVKSIDYYRDNQSCMKMERNGKASAGAKSRHIHTRFFWIKDRLSVDNINLVYCPTEKMLADFFTKPLQGSLFKMMRDYIMGVIPIREILKDMPVTDKERVGNRPSTGHTQTNKFQRM
jgi:hypothetical protein